MKVVLQETFGPLKLTVKESEDRLALIAEAEPVKSESSCKIDRHSLTLLLREHIDPERLNPSALDLIAQAINEGKHLLDRRIAHGKEPTEGKPGRLELIVKKVSPPNRTADTRFVRDLNSVIPGTILGKLHPPERGNPGYDVYGTAIEAKLGSPLKIVCDRSISLKPSYEEGGYQYLVAQTAGFFVEDQSRFAIEKNLEIKSDVDITSGSVKFIGDVTVAKDVMKGFDISTDRNIHIIGRTHGGSLKSRFGAIKVNEIVVGAQKSVVDSTDNFSALMLQNISIKCGGDVMIGKDVRDTSIDCMGRLLMPRGNFFGSVIKTTFGLDARIIGSPSGSKTIISARSADEITELLERLRVQLQTNQELRDSILAKIGPLTENSEKLPPLGSGQCLTINKLLIECWSLNEEEKLISSRIAKYEGALARGIKFRVNYQEKLHKGVVICADKETFVVDSDISGPGTVEYSTQEHKFIVGRQKPLEQFILEGTGRRSDPDIQAKQVAARL